MNSNFENENMPVNGSPKKPKKKKKVIFIILGIILALVAAVVVFAAVKYNHYYSLSNYVSKSDAATAEESVDESTLSEAVNEDNLTDEEKSYIDSQASAIEENPTLPNNSNIYNLLVIGVDRRDTSWNGNSDCMILLSVNKDTKKITMMSFMRDLYANIEPYGTQKLNFSCAIGGPTRVVSAIEENYKVDIDNYVCVDFTAVENIVDAIGGVDIDVREEEIPLINSTVADDCKSKDLSVDDNMIQSAGTVHMNGMQALAYSRLRYVGNADWERTERQRKVLTKIFNKVKALSLSELDSTAETVLPMITHDIESSKLLSLLASLPTFLSYELVSTRVPYDGTYTIINEILVPDMATEISMIQNELYGE